MYLPPHPDQPGVYDDAAAAKRQAHEYATLGNPSPALDNDGYVADELGRRASLLKDCNGYVVDNFNPYELGRRATINVGTRHASGGATVYAVPVADEERSATLANDSSNV